MDNIFANAHPTPDGKWIMAQGIFSDGRSLLTLYNMTNLPIPTSDGVNRTDFEAQTVSITGSAVAGTTNVVVEFGYDTNPYCTSRQEVCVSNYVTFTDTAASCSGSGGTMPFLYPIGDCGSLASVTGVACATTCTVQIPVIPGHVANYIVDFRNGSNAVLFRGPASGTGTSGTLTAVAVN
jgi:hypothetical protein